MQNGTKHEQVLDILDNAIAVMSAVRLDGTPVYKNLGDVRANLASAMILVGEIATTDPQGPVGTINPERDRHNFPHRTDTHLYSDTTVRAYDVDCAECARIGFCTWCQGPCTIDFGDLPVAWDGRTTSYGTGMAE